ncbi:hypothetical protein P691DRAFT_754760 [Macrolepiota fuliginosa MF-IS2]|uniref:Uncharacterized protein n=1 Tax=Macrolepiota fuliginosa MF-IS2 TaxID=1400762 RepID=A0A9P6C9R9_9AGAR|nr:hypothetical protein P691DRAFT_754760 [Macrolepiota fuliginosa MF-IS2]
MARVVNSQDMPDQQPQPSAASRMLVSVTRSMRHGRSHSHSHSHSQSQSTNMYSTPEESQPRHSASFREPAASARPTIEQIAMGLHVSRTPHLRSRPPSHSASASPRQSSPLRSSLKKQSFASSDSALVPAAASASTSTVTSASIHMVSGTGTGLRMTASSVSPRLHHGGTATNALAAIKLRVAKLLPGERKRGESSPTLVIATASGAETTARRKSAARKAVRFESLAPDTVDQQRQ